MKLFKAILFFFLFGTSLWASNYVVIVHKKVTETSLSSKEIVDVFTGNIDTWKDGTSISPSHGEEGTESGTIFFNSVVEMSAQKYKKIWLKKLFAGYGAEPMALSSPEEIVDYVKSVDGAIGIVPAGTTTDGCTVVDIK